MRSSNSDNKFTTTTPQKTGPDDTDADDPAAVINNDNKPPLSLSPLGPHDEDEDEDEEGHGGGNGFVTFDSPFPNVDQLKDDELPTWKEVMVKVNSCSISCSAQGHEAAVAAAAGRGGTSEIKRNRTEVTEDTVDTSIEGGDREQEKDDIDPYSEDFMEDLFPALADETTTMESTGGAVAAAVPRNSSNQPIYSGSVAGFGTGSAFATVAGNEVEVTAAVDGVTLPDPSQFKPIKDDSSDEEKEIKTSLSSYYKNILAVKNYLAPSSKDRKSDEEASNIITSSNTNRSPPFDDGESLLHPNSNELGEEEEEEAAEEEGVGNRTSSTTSSNFRFETIYTEEKDIIIDMVEDPAAKDRLDGTASEGAVGGGVSVAQNAGPEYQNAQSVSKSRSGGSSGVAMNLGIELGSDDDFEIVAGGGSTSSHNENEKSLTSNANDDDKRRGRFLMLVAGLLCLLLTICAIALGVGLSKEKDGQPPSPAVSANAAATSPPATTFTRPPASATSSSPAPVSAPTISPTTPATNVSPTLEPENQPVVSPTDVPTSQLTAEPTPQPTTALVSPTNPQTEVQCNEDTISVSQACVSGQDSIIIDFSVCNPTASDWIGLYSDNRAAVVPNGDGTFSIDASYYDWAFTCGDKECSGSPSSNAFALPINNPALGQLSLRVYLNREGNGQTWEIVAQSQAFVLTNPCG
mmetsp:Transcript_11745/g.28124  ORF Transcript_11745/g.28124 Transcript_11745/m.28124 type:complete len:690 (+) Transcript_11745:1-2070(+)